MGCGYLEKIRTQFSRKDIPRRLKRNQASFDDIAIYAIYRRVPRLRPSTVHRYMVCLRRMETHVVPVNLRNPDFDNWLDNRTKEESRKRGVVIDANLSAWMAEDPNLRIYVRCPFEERVKRIAEREEGDYRDVEQETG